MSFRLLSVIVLLGLGGPALAKPPEMPLDPTVNCCACAVAESVDDLLLVTLVEQQKSWTYRDLMLEMLVPALRLRHLSPERVKAAADDLHAVFANWRELMAQAATEKDLNHLPCIIP